MAVRTAWWAAWCAAVALAVGDGLGAATKQEIRVPGWPDFSGRVPLSTGILSRGLVLASGMAGFDMQTLKLVGGGVEAETRQALSLVQRIMEAAGSDMAHVAACAVYLKDLKDFAAMNEAYGTFFPRPRPSRVAMQVASLAGNASVEIQCLGGLPNIERREVLVPTWPDMTTRFPFSTGIVLGDFVFASGMPGFDMSSGKLTPGGVQAETTKALANIRQVLEAGGSSMANVVNCAVYLQDMRDFAAMNEVYTEFFPKPQPSRVAMQVAALAGNASVEIQCVAALPAAGRVQVVVPTWPDMSARFPFSNGIVSGGFLFASGMAGFNMQTMTLVPGGVQAETKQALALMEEVVLAGGSTMADVVSCAVYLRDMKDFAAMNEVYATFFPKPPPARVATQIAALVKGAAVEIQCTAALPATSPAETLLV